MLPKDDIFNQIAQKLDCKNKSLRRVFREFDSDGGGTLDKDEFRGGLASLGFDMNDQQYT